MVDALRWATVFFCVFNIGTLGALYEQVGRFFLPKTAMRMLLVSNMLLMTAFGLTAHARLGHPMTYRMPLLSAATGLQLAAEIFLYRWYRTAEGKNHIDRMLKDRDEH